MTPQICPRSLLLGSWHEHTQRTGLEQGDSSVTKDCCDWDSHLFPPSSCFFTSADALVAECMFCCLSQLTFHHFIFMAFAFSIPGPGCPKSDFGIDSGLASSSSSDSQSFYTLWEFLDLWILLLFPQSQFLTLCLASRIMCSHLKMVRG